MQTGKIIGRRAEIDRLTQWTTKSPSPMMHVVAIGSMGKSAPTWEWFHHIAPQEWPKMKGRMWWSFYESDGHFENFVTRSLAYVSGQAEKDAGAGTFVHMPSGLKHSIKAKTPVVMLLVLMK